MPIPPLAAVRVFEAAARHLSFTKAAKELGMTQAAVSYQIKVLEERLGSQLFLRQPKGLALTNAGHELAPDVGRAFDVLRDAFSRFAETEAGTLTVNTTHAFASQWLAPRLGAFQLAHAGIAVRLETTNRVVDFASEEIDVVIRAGRGDWPGLTAIRLLGITYTPMLSPSLAESIGGIREPADLLKLPLLDPKDPWWPSWLAANELPLDILDWQTAPSLGLQVLDAEAAMAGLGVALLMPAHFQRELAEGRLIRPLAEVIEDGRGYWLAYPESRRNVPKIKAFRDWIVAEAAKES